MPIPWNQEGDGADAALHFACDNAKCSAIRTDGGGYSAMDAAAASESESPLGKLAAETYAKIVDEGLGEKDFSVAYEYLRRKSE